LSSNIVADRGWLSWQHYRCNRDCKTDPENCFSETLIKRTADLMVWEGYKDAGYLRQHVSSATPQMHAEGPSALAPVLEQC